MPRALASLATCALFGAATLAPAPLAAQGYGPVLAPLQTYQMHRGDALDVAIGKRFDWAEVEGEAVAAFMREDNSLRLVALKQGTATVVATDEGRLVWRAEIVVR